MNPEPSCVGKSWLFDSTDPTDAREAAAICATCPRIYWCKQQYRAATRAAAVGGGPEGTWAGQLRGVRKSKAPQAKCLRGHDRTPENVYGRKCRQCSLERSAQKRQEEREAKGQARRWSYDALADEWDHLRSIGTSIHEAARQLSVTVEAIEVAVRKRERSAA